MKKNRHLVKRLLRKVKAGMADLRVVGSQKQGFRLAVEDADHLLPFGYSFRRQIDAVQYGQSTFNSKPRKMLQRLTTNG